MLADIDDPPRSRARGLLIGLLIAAPPAVGAAYVGIPLLQSIIVGESEDFDVRLRQEDAYMQAVCTDALVVDRDEALCSCALAAEYPSLDCRSQFTIWSLERQLEQCAQPDMAQLAVSFCACVEKLGELRSATDDPDERRKIGQRYAGCTEFEETLFLPEVATLMPDQA